MPPAEIGSLSEEASRTQSILQIGIHLEEKKFLIRNLMNIINLNFFAELLTLDLYKGSRHSFHVRVSGAKGDPPASDRVFVLVRVNSRVHYAWLGRAALVKPPVYKVTAFSALRNADTSK